jgi:hypothetical protein
VGFVNATICRSVRRAAYFEQSRSRIVATCGVEAVQHVDKVRSRILSIFRRDAEFVEYIVGRLDARLRCTTPCGDKPNGGCVAPHPASNPAAQTPQTGRFKLGILTDNFEPHLRRNLTALSV